MQDLIAPRFLEQWVASQLVGQVIGWASRHRGLFDQTSSYPMFPEYRVGITADISERFKTYGIPLNALWAHWIQSSDSNAIREAERLLLGGFYCFKGGTGGNSEYPRYLYVFQERPIQNLKLWLGV